MFIFCLWFFLEILGQRLPIFTFFYWTEVLCKRESVCFCVCFCFVCLFFIVLFFGGTTCKCQPVWYGIKLFLRKTQKNCFPSRKRTLPLQQISCKRGTITVYGKQWNSEMFRQPLSSGKNRCCKQRRVVFYQLIWLIYRLFYCWVIHNWTHKCMMSGFQHATATFPSTDPSSLSKNECVVTNGKEGHPGKDLPTFLCT